MAWSPIRKLMKDNGAVMVHRDAVDALIEYLVRLAESITNKSLEITRHNRRDRITGEDIELAIESRGIDVIPKVQWKKS